MGHNLAILWLWICHMLSDLWPNAPRRRALCGLCWFYGSRAKNHRKPHTILLSLVPLPVTQLMRPICSSAHSAAIKTDIWLVSRLEASANSAEERRELLLHSIQLALLMCSTLSGIVFAGRFFRPIEMSLCRKKKKNATASLFCWRSGVGR